MALQAPDRTRVLYIAGLGRTGSTVLGQALGGMPNITFAGELTFFWRRFANGELCSCRRPLPDCPFWSEVVAKAYGGITRSEALRLGQLERHVLRRQWLRLGPFRRGSDQISQMLDERAQLYRAISDVAGTDWVIDAGKEPLFASVMTRLDSAEFGAIHIVRDPRGVAFSCLKRVRSDSEPGFMGTRSAASTAAHWVLQNLLIQVSLQRAAGPYVRVRYEDFVTRPADIVGQIATAAQIALPVQDATVSGQDIKIDEHHLVAGNPGVRAHGAGSVRLSLDDEWRSRLPSRKRWLVTAICAPLMAVYGYRP